MIDKRSENRAVPVSPVGTHAVVAARQRADRSSVYRAQTNARAASREVAWLLIRYRMDRGFSQEELAERAGARAAQIKRLESGRYTISVETLLRIAHALGVRLVLGFERTVAERDLVAL